MSVLAHILDKKNLFLVIAEASCGKFINFVLKQSR